MSSTAANGQRALETLRRVGLSAAGHDQVCTSIYADWQTLTRRGRRKGRRIVRHNGSAANPCSDSQGYLRTPPQPGSCVHSKYTSNVCKGQATGTIVSGRRQQEPFGEEVGKDHTLARRLGNQRGRVYHALSPPDISRNEALMTKSQAFGSGTGTSLSSKDTECNPCL